MGDDAHKSIHFENYLLESPIKLYSSITVKNSNKSSFKINETHKKNLKRLNMAKSPAFQEFNCKLNFRVGQRYLHQIMKWRWVLAKSVWFIV